MQVNGDAPLDPLDGVAQRLDQDHVDDAGPDIGLEVEARRIDAPRHAHQVVDGDQRHHGRALDHQDDLVAVGPERHDQRLRQDDLAHRRQSVQPERSRALPLAPRHAFDRAAQDLGLVGRRVQREGENGAIPGFAEEPPQSDRFQFNPEGAEAVIDEEGLREQRRAAEEIDVAVGDGLEELVLRHARIGDRYGKYRAEQDAR